MNTAATTARMRASRFPGTGLGRLPEPGREVGGADAPDEAADDQDPEGRREGRAQGAERVEAQTRVEHGLAAEPIGEGTVEHHCAGHAQKIQGHHERHPRRVGSETEPHPDVGEGRKRHVHPQRHSAGDGGQHGDELPLGDPPRSSPLGGCHNGSVEIRGLSRIERHDW